MTEHFSVDGPIAVTPDPSVHNIPPQNAGIGLPSGQTFVGLAEKLLAAIAQQVVLALEGAVTHGLHDARAALQSFGASALGAVDDIESLITGVLGVGHDIGDLVTFLTGLSVGAIDQDLRNAVANALGHTGGEPYSSAQVLTFLEDIPADVIQSVFGGSNLGADVQGFMSHLGSTFPKTFPFTFGTSNNTTLANFVPFSQWQQLLDGIVNDGQTGHDVTATIGSFRKRLDRARSDATQAVTDGITGANTNTAVARLLQLQPPQNILSLFENQNLGQDVQNFMYSLGSSFPKSFPFTFGTSTSGQVGNFVSLSQWQQLLDGVVNDGNIGHSPADAVAALRRHLDHARSDVSQAIMDGATGANANTGIAHVLQNFSISNLIDEAGNAIIGYLANLTPAGIFTDLTKVVDTLGNDLAGYLTNVSHNGIFTSLTAIEDNLGNALSGYVANLSHTGLFTDFTKIVDTGSNELSAWLSNMNSSGQFKGLTAILDGSNNPLSGYLTNLGSAGRWTDITKIFDTGSNALSAYLTNVSSAGHWTDITKIFDTGSVALSTYLTNVSNTGHWSDITKIFDTSSNPLSTYLTHITGSTGAIAPAGLGTGTLPGGVAMAASQLTGALASGVSVVGTQVSADIGTVTTDIQTQVGNLVDNVHQAINNNGVTGNPVSTVKTDVNNLLTGLKNAFIGASATAASYSDVATGAAAHSTNIIATGATVAQLQQPSANLGLASASVNFSSYANAASLPGVFTSYIVGSGTGAWSVASGLATWSAGTGLSSDVAIYNVQETFSDYQTISIIISDIPEQNGQTCLIGRSDNSSGWGNSIQLSLVGAASATVLTGSLYYNISGSATQLGSNFTLPYVPGATYSLVCGTPTGPRYFQVLINGVAQSIGSGGANYIQDTGGSSRAGSGYRYTGLAGIGNASTYAPLTISWFGMQDQVFPAGPPVVDTMTGPGTTTATSYTSTLTSATAPAVTVTIGSSGMAQVFLVAGLASSAHSCNAGFAVSGATTVAASTANSVIMPATNGGGDVMQLGAPFLLTDLTPGGNTFTMEFLVAGGTGTFTDCTITAIPI